MAEAPEGSYMALVGALLPQVPAQEPHHQLVCPHVRREPRGQAALVGGLPGPGAGQEEPVGPADAGSVWSCGKVLCQQDLLGPHVQLGLAEDLQGPQQQGLQ